MVIESRFPTQRHREYRVGRCPILCVLLASVFQFFSYDLLLPKLISGLLDIEELDIETGQPLTEAKA